MPRYLTGQELSRNSVDTTTELFKSAKRLETEEEDIESHNDSKVRETLNCVITAMSLAIRIM